MSLINRKLPDVDEKDVEYFYKYLPFDDGSLKIITEGTIKFTRPSEFNDPFDCLPGTDDSVVDNMGKGYLKNLGERLGLSPSERILQKKKQIQKLKAAVSSGVFTHGVNETIGVLSLSKTPISPLMWSHYADFHKGFVVEFRIPASSGDPELFAAYRKNLLLSPQPVIYSKDRPMLDLNIPNDDDEAWSQVVSQLYTKNIDWAYEQECRVIMPNREPGIFPYERNWILNSVIAGACIGDRIKELELIVDQLNNDQGISVELFKAKLSDNKYSISIPGHQKYQS